MLRRLKQVGSASAKIVTGIVALATILGTMLAFGLIKPFGTTEPTPAQAATRSIDQGTSRADCTITAIPASGRPAGGAHFSFDGTFDYLLNRGSATYDFSELSLLTAGRLPTTLRTFTDDDIIYDQVTSKGWIAFDSSTLYGTDVGPLFAYTGQPAGLLKALSTSGNVHRDGEDQLAGGPATRYTGTIDAAKVADGAPTNQRASLQLALGALERHGWSTDWPANVWVGQDGLVHRVSLQFTLNNGSLTRDCYLSDFGVPFHSTPPAAIKVHITNRGNFFATLGLSRERNTSLKLKGLISLLQVALSTPTVAVRAEVQPRSLFLSSPHRQQLRATSPPGR